MMHFISNGALGMLLALSLQCQAESITNIVGTSSAPKISGACSNLFITELSDVEAMSKFLGTNHPVSIVTHSDAWRPENAQCFLVTGTSLTAPATCDEPASPLLIEAFFLNVISGSGRLNEAEVARRRTILREILSKEEPALLEKLGQEDTTKWLEWIIPAPEACFLGNFAKFSRISTAAFVNPKVKECILKAIEFEKINSVPKIESLKE